MLFTVQELESIRNISKQVSEDIGLSREEIKEAKKRSSLNVVGLLENFLITYSLFKSISENEKVLPTVKDKIQNLLSQFPYTTRIRILIIQHNRSYEKEGEEEKMLDLIEKDIDKIEDFINTVFMTTKVLSDEQPDFNKFQNQNIGGVFE